MATRRSIDITAYLREWNQGNDAALDKLLPHVYNELRKLARSYLRKERADHTLQPTALVHEAFLKLIDQNSITWENRSHFFGICARIMRQVLVSYAVSHQATKRGGKAKKISIDDVTGLVQSREVDVISLNDALTSLEALDARQSQIVELRYFAGLSIEEAAEVLGISPATVKREWSTAKLWLRRQLSNPKAEKHE